MAKRSYKALQARVRLPHNKPKVKGYCNPDGRLYLSTTGGVIVARHTCLAERLSAVSA